MLKDSWAILALAVSTLVCLAVASVSTLSISVAVPVVLCVALSFASGVLVAAAMGQAIPSNKAISIMLGIISIAFLIIWFQAW